jgi:glycosyltransferase involved in cell wall biosynthesis
MNPSESTGPVDHHPPTVTVAIATYNRAAEVEKTLAGLALIDTAGCPEYEILVVDNNSTDGTGELVGRLAPRFRGRLRCVREENQGLSHARNRAIEEARYEIVAYLDDDVDTDPRWLRNLTATYANTDAVVVGGRAFLVYPGPRPRWLGDAIEGLLTKVELGPYRRTAVAGEIYGVNLSFRKDWLKRAGGFRTDIGRIGTTLFGGEDDDMVARVAALGGVVIYEPTAAVGHRVPQSRLTREWFRKRCFWGSVSSPRMWSDEQVCQYELARTAWHVGLTAWRALRVALRCGPRSAACFQQLMNMATRAGLWFGLARELWRRRGLLVRGRSRTTELCPAG